MVGRRQIGRPQRVVRVPGTLGAKVTQVTRHQNEFVSEVNTELDRLERATKNVHQRQLVGPWFKLNTPADITGDMAIVNAVAVVEWLAHRSGSLIGLSVMLSEAHTVGSYTVKVEKNGAAIHTFEFTIGDTEYIKTFPKGSLKFLAKDKLKVTYVTDVDFEPFNVIDVLGWLEVEM